jgi:uncharacterized protein (TIGR00255 family)
MTGYGSGSSGREGRRVLVTVQGWNHRNADLVFRLPEELRPLEAELRERVRRSVLRGRCEVAVRLETGGGTAAARRLDREAMARFLAESEELVRAGTVERRWTLGELARSPFVVAQTAPEETEAETRGDLEAALDAALAGFDAARRSEGERAHRNLADALSELGGLVGRIAARRDRGAGEAEARIRQRLDEILPGGSAALPPERLAQEVVLLADRSDVREELERLSSHLASFAEIFAAPGPHGRRLDFLVQEVLRELNTLGSKSRDLETTRWVVEAKVVNERLREQIANVE